MRKMFWKHSPLRVFTMWTLIKVMLFIILHDILKREQNKVRTQELVKNESQKKMNEFLSIASHELKTPLTSIKGNIQLILRKLKTRTDQNSTSEGMGSMSSDNTAILLKESRELLERTDKQVAQLTRLVNTLLESSRLGTSAVDLLLERCEMATLMKEAVQDTNSIPGTRTIHLTVPDDATVTVTGDADRLKLVMVHLLSNAHKFSPLQECIDIDLKKEDDLVRFSIRDSGPGIPPVEHNKIWEIYYRVPNIVVQNGSEIGLGLGLHMCRMIIEQHNGHIGLQSTVGSGSTFWFTLPLYAA